MRILLIDDDLTLSLMLRTWLSKKGYEVETASSVSAASKMLFAKNGHPFHLVLSDLRLPDRDGLSLLSEMRARGLDRIPFILMTSYAEVQGAVEAMKLGADDYVAKPIQPDLLLRKMQEALEKKSCAATPPSTVSLAPSHPQQDGPIAAARLEGTSPVARRLYEMASLVAPTPMSVLIVGASGTGKEYVARRIHRDSKRADGPFVAIDCGALTKELAASELFGHAKGAFTGAVSDKQGAFVEATGGTLFLDEVGNLGYDVQVQLLRALQEQRIRPVGSGREVEVDIRLVCATNENLLEAIAKGGFREDLYHRINQFTLEMPLLRERGEDILAFARFFLQQANAELDRQVSDFDMEAQAEILRYSWPGNLREMKNTVTRATLLAQAERVTAADLNLPTLTHALPAPAALHSKDEELQRIEQALLAAKGNKSLAAKILGVDRKTLYNKLKLHSTNEG